ncbi:hypothetical protein [Clostridium sp.]|uniref:hypothetical protein n=1 Tax=Clostridium sp. TaxID=1506 RepID=UPI00258BC5B2|nr:hypothetical protein [Clostridium sp.]MDF2505872.1 sucrose phosphorylase [Clostridium sp.]
MRELLDEVKEILEHSEEILEISWKKDEFKTILKANVKTHKFTIKYFDVDSNEFKELAEV